MVPQSIASIEMQQDEAIRPILSPSLMCSFTSLVLRSVLRASLRWIRLRILRVKNDFTFSDDGTSPWERDKEMMHIIPEVAQL